MRFSISARTSSVVLRYSLVLFLSVLFSVSYAQQAKTVRPAKTNWQANLKRMYLFTDVHDAPADNLDYSSDGKFSIRSIANNSVLFKGENINKNDSSLHAGSRLVFIIDPIRQAESKKKETIIAPVTAEVKPVAKDFSVYPNPIVSTSQQITLGLDDFENGKEIQVSLFDGLGRVINQQSFTLKDKQQTVAIPQLSSGMYFVKISEKDSQYSKKLLVR
ncbi:T9SS type A sorting domain-containing protein [Dyadobacter sp. NIV53]|uniref:T9SS type A sorting domain-containing protein n=1 Tax=Dyadobacter sp. NIV53 TaxID=2861765 RepID=UPI001C86EA5E|nr:T9SS type A sorting domain-containing protein [Dyadobacter sp. NIV53]